MATRADRVIRFLKDQLARLSMHSNDRSSVFPVATLGDVRSAENMLGFEIPALLARIYLEIGNGGRHLGPGFGILGLPGGFGSDDGWDIVKTSLEMAASYEWWDSIIVVSDRGCSMMSCVDCSDADFTVYLWDGNQFDEQADCDEPSDELWQVEADSFEEWLRLPNSG